MTRPTWETYFLGIAEAVSARADCSRRKVGAVVADTHNRVLAAGYNGAPSGERGCLAGGCPRGRLGYEEVPEGSNYDNCVAIHAEVNALIIAGAQARGSTIYITHAPCYSCQKVIQAAGCARAVWTDGEVRWETSLQ